MAKNQNPCLSTEATGRLGSVVWSNSRSGARSRIWYPPVDPKSFDQTAWRREVFSKVAFYWQNSTLSAIRAWHEFADNFYPSSISLRSTRPTAQNLFFRHNLNRLLCGLAILTDPPLSPICDFFAVLSVAWTSSGASLAWTPPIPSDCFVIVRQVRNLHSCNFAQKRGPISHIFDSSISSPQLLTPPCGNGGGPGKLAAFNCQSWIHFQVYCLDSFGRSTPELFFPLFAG